MSIEQLLLFGLFLLVGLIDFVLRRLRRRGTSGREEARDDEPPARQTPDVESRAGRPHPPRVRLSSPLPEVPVVAVRATPPAPSASRSAREAGHPRLPLGSRADLRRAIVLMTVLGPSAAQEAEERQRPR